jgi:hypothetical protein
VNPLTRASAATLQGSSCIFIARKVRRDPTIIERAKAAHARQAEQFAGWRFVGEWNELLALPPAYLVPMLINRDSEMVWLRNSSPFYLIEDVKTSDYDTRVRLSRAARRVVIRGVAAYRRRPDGTDLSPLLSLAYLVRYGHVTDTLNEISPLARVSKSLYNGTETISKRFVQKRVLETADAATPPRAVFSLLKSATGRVRPGPAAPGRMRPGTATRGIHYLLSNVGVGPVDGGRSSFTGSKSP